MLDAFVAIVEAQDQELKDAAKSGLESIGKWEHGQSWRNRVVNVLMPIAARAAQAVDGIDWPKEVKETGRKLRDRTSGMDM